MVFENRRSLVKGNSPQVEKETACQPVEVFTWGSQASPMKARLHRIHTPFGI